MKTETIGTTGVPTDFGTTRFPCGCIMGWHKIAEIAQWAPCKVHGATPELLEALELLARNYCPACGCDQANTPACDYCNCIQIGRAAIRKAKGEV